MVATYNAFAEQLSEQPVQNHSISNISYLCSIVGLVTYKHIYKDIGGIFNLRKVLYHKLIKT